MTKIKKGVGDQDQKDIHDHLFIYWGVVWWWLPPGGGGRCSCRASFVISFLQRKHIAEAEAVVTPVSCSFPRKNVFSPSTSLSLSRLFFVFGNVSQFAIFSYTKQCWSQRRTSPCTIEKYYTAIMQENATTCWRMRFYAKRKKEATIMWNLKSK